MLGLASDDRIIERVRGRALLLCACAAAVLPAQPALAAPDRAGPSDIADFGFATEKGTPTRSPVAVDRIGQGPAVAPGEADLPTLPRPMTANRGAFDVRVDRSEPTEDERARGSLPSLSASIPLGVAPPGAAQVEQMLVTSQAAPPASEAHVQDGTIILSSVTVGAPPKPDAPLADDSHTPPPPPPPPPPPEHPDTHPDHPSPPPPPPPPPPEHPDTHPDHPSPPPPPPPEHPDTHHPAPPPPAPPEHPDTHHPAPPPPPDHPNHPPPAPPPPPPPPPAQVPRDEIVTALGSDDSGKKKKQTDDLVDLSLLNASDDGSQIDTGVTSGADPSEWDPIDINSPH